MDLGRAAYECRLLIDELRESLPEAEVEKLCQELEECSRKEWVDYVRSNSHVAAYALATAGERKKRKGWAEPTNRRRLAAAAIVRLQHAYACLKAMDSYRLWASDSYRPAISAAASSWEMMSQAEIPWWPFADIPEPFSG